MKRIALGLAVGMALGFAARPAAKKAKQFMNVGSQKPPGYTHVVTSAPGKMIFISGRGGTAADGSMPADFAAQAKNTFEDLKKCLALAGATFNDVVKINYYVTDMANTPELRRVRGPAARGGRRVLRDARQHRDALAHVRDRGLQEFALLARVERGVLAHAAHHHDAVNARGQLRVEVRERAGHVQGVIGVELRAHRGEHAAPRHFHGNLARHLVIGA